MCGAGSCWERCCSRSASGSLNTILLAGITIISPLLPMGFRMGAQRYVNEDLEAEERERRNGEEGKERERRNREEGKERQEK